MLEKKKSEIDMLNGPMLGKIIKTTIPIVLTNVLQIFYNSADMFVVGNYCEDPNALGSVGCTSALIQLILGLFIGLGAGVCVVLAQCMGEGNGSNVSKVVHTSVLLALLLGGAVTVIGYFLAPEMLVWMKTTDEFLENATLYTRIYFCGSIGNIMYNFCSGILRSRGDTLRPLIFSGISGIINIILNLFFVISLGMGVEGVAIATIVSQFLSAAMAVIHLMRLDDDCRLCPRKLAIDKTIMIRLLKIGVPAGIHGMLFAISNVILQSSYNKLGPLYVNANTAESNVETYSYNILNAFYHSALSFASQNYGARKTDRVRKVFYISAACILVTGIVYDSINIIFADSLIKIFEKDPEIVAAAKIKLYIMLGAHFLCGFQELSTAMLRSIGYSSMSTIGSFLGTCVFRIFWIYTVFAASGSNVYVLYMVYPISWLITFAVGITTFFILLRKREREMGILERI